LSGGTVRSGEHYIGAAVVAVVFAFVFAFVFASAVAGG
jgi:hypothetical protein